MFLPLDRPHAFQVVSDELHCIGFITPGGFFDVISKMNAPAERMEVPTDTNAVTYANADMTDTIKIFERYGLRFLTADEIRRRCRGILFNSPQCDVPRPRVLRPRRCKIGLLPFHQRSTGLFCRSFSSG
jgi:hypothetical protein